MAKNFIQAGDVVGVTAPADVKSGALVKVGMLVGVAQYDAATGEHLEIAVGGVFELPKVSAQAWTEGAPLYMVPASSLVTTAATAGNVLIGVALVAAANPSATGIVRLNGAAPAAATS